MTNRLFIFGLGYSGVEIARQAKAAGWSVAGTVRSAAKVKQLAAEGIEAHLLDGAEPLPSGLIGGTTHVLCTIAPGRTGDPVLATCTALLREACWLGYLSTTGIYGPGRSAIDQVKAGTARRIDKPGQVFSRIHVEDIAATVLAAIERPSAGAIYNVSDDLPAPTPDVIAHACRLLARPVPPLVPWAEVAPTLSAMARSFYAENRRVRNDRIKHELGVRLRYPTYREGLQAILAVSRRP